MNSSSGDKSTPLKSSPRVKTHHKCPSDTGSQCLDADDTGSSDIEEDDVDWRGGVAAYSTDRSPSRPLLE